MTPVSAMKLCGRVSSLPPKIGGSRWLCRLVANLISERMGPPDSLRCAEIFQTWQEELESSLLRGGSIAALVHGGCLLLDYVPVVAHGHQGHRWWQRKGWRSCWGLCVSSLLMACSRMVGDVPASPGLRRRGITLRRLEVRPCPGTLLSREDASSTEEPRSTLGGGHELLEVSDPVGAGGRNAAPSSTAGAQEMGPHHRHSEGHNQGIWVLKVRFP
nr:uncharacterized protein LOC110358142 isoform X2 [Columba livia]